MTGNIIMFTGLLQPTDVLVAVDAVCFIPIYKKH